METRSGHMNALSVSHGIKCDVQRQHIRMQYSCRLSVWSCTNCTIYWP